MIVYQTIITTSENLIENHIIVSYTLPGMRTPCGSRVRKFIFRVRVFWPRVRKFLNQNCEFFLFFKKILITLLSVKRSQKLMFVNHRKEF